MCTFTEASDDLIRGKHYIMNEIRFVIELYEMIDLVVTWSQFDMLSL